MDALTPAEITEHVQRAVGNFRIMPSETARWTDLLAANPNNADLLESLVSVPEVSTNREATTTFSAGSYQSSSPAPVNLSSGDYRTGHPARAPKLFDAGDLPTTTASGLDPHTLTSVPWQARKAVARAKTHAEAHELIEKYSGELGQAQADFDALDGGALFADVNDYSERLEEWGSFEATDVEAFQLTGGRTEEFKKEIDAWSAEQGKSSNQPYWPWADPIDMFNGGQPRRYPGPVERKGK